MLRAISFSARSRPFSSFGDAIIEREVVMDEKPIDHERILKISRRHSSMRLKGAELLSARPTTSSRSVHHLALISEAARLGDLGVRILLCPNDHVQNAARVLRDRSRQPAIST
jgi:hypothetical protein